MQAHGAELSGRCRNIGGLETQIREAGDDLFFGAGDDEVAILIGHAAGDQAGVYRIEQLHVGVGQGLALVVDEMADELLAVFLHAFHGDEAVADGGLNGIETNDLADGIAERGVLNADRDSVVLQFVIDKADMIALGCLAEVDEHLGHGTALVVARDALSRGLGQNTAEYIYNGKNSLHKPILL